MAAALSTTREHHHQEMGQTPLPLRSQTWLPQVPVRRSIRKITVAWSASCPTEPILPSPLPDWLRRDAETSLSAGSKSPASHRQDEQNCSISFLRQNRSCVPDTIFFLKKKIIIICTWEAQIHYALPLNNDLGQQKKKPACQMTRLWDHRASVICLSRSSFLWLPLRSSYIFKKANS